MTGLVIIQSCLIPDLEAFYNFKDLLCEYAEESAISGLPPPSARMDMYRALNKTGVLKVWSAVLDGMLIGFITVLAPILPHYGIPVAVCESFFVAEKWRKTGAGLKLLRQAEDYTAEVNSPGLLISAPVGSRIEQVLLGLDYAETNRVFFRKTK